MLVRGEIVTDAELIVAFLGIEMVVDAFEPADAKVTLLLETDEPPLWNVDITSVTLLVELMLTLVWLPTFWNVVNELVVVDKNELLVNDAVYLLVG